MNNIMPNSNILMYTTEDGLTKIEATFDNDTVWLSIDQMAELFQRDRSVIGKHVRNIFKEGELDKNSVWAKFAYTASDGKNLLFFSNRCKIKCTGRHIGTPPQRLFISVQTRKKKTWG
jgi:hypothetical protein